MLRYPDGIKTARAQGTLNPREAVLAVHTVCDLDSMSGDTATYAVVADAVILQPPVVGIVADVGDAEGADAFGVYHSTASKAKRPASECVERICILVEDGSCASHVAILLK